MTINLKSFLHHAAGLILVAFRCRRDINVLNINKYKVEQMMKITKRLFYSLLMILVSANILIAADIHDEILGIRWGTEIFELKNFSKLWQKDAVSFYVNPGANHTIYEVKIPNVVYGFYVNKFFAVYAKIDDPTVFARLKSHLMEKYGDPKMTQTMKNEQRIFTWKDQKIKIKLKYYQADGKMKLAFYYTPLSTTVNDSQQEKLQKDTWKLFPIDKGLSPQNMKPEDLPSIPLFRF